MMEDAQKSDRVVMAKEYDALHNRLFVIQVLLIIGLLVLFQISGLSAYLANELTTRFGVTRWWLVNPVYIAISVFSFSICMFPLTYYSDYVVERYYGLSTEDFGPWFSDFIKSLLIDVALAAFLFSVIYALLRWLPQHWWLLATLFYVLFGLFFSMLYPVVIMPLFHRFEPLEEGELTQVVRTMMEQANIRVVGVYKWGLEGKTTTANAAFTGFGRTRRIILGDTLLSGYSQDEILSILAHEIGHYKNRDMTRLMGMGAVLALAGFYLAHWSLVHLASKLGFENIFDIGTAPLFIFCLFIFSLISMPLANLHSRTREFAADAYAAETMGSSEALVSAFEKLADQNLSNKQPAAWVEFLLHSHPSISRRIARLQQR